MSNSKRARWNQDQIDASNALDALADLWNEAEAYAVREVIVTNLLRDLAAAGHSPDLLAAVEHRVRTGLDDAAWVEIGHSSGMLPAGGGV